MLKARRMVLFAAPALFLGLASCAPPVHSYRYRLTLEVEADGAVRRVSTVRESFYRPSVDSLQGLSTSQKTASGPPVVVDLGPRGVLIATLMGRERDPKTGRFGTNDYLWGPSPIIGRTLARSGRRESYALAPKLFSWPRRARVEIPLDDLPLLLRLRAANDPSYAEIVDPADLSTTFGPGVRIKAAYVEPTSEQLSFDEAYVKLPWAERYVNQKLRLTGNSFELFSRGINVAPNISADMALKGYKP